MSKEYYIPGDWWVLCDVCHRKVRSSKVVKDWKGRIVHADPNEGCFETRHPQEFVRATGVDPRPLPFVRVDNDGIDSTLTINCDNQYLVVVDYLIEADKFIGKGHTLAPASGVLIQDGVTVTVYCLWTIE